MDSFSYKLLHIFEEWGCLQTYIFTAIPVWFESSHSAVPFQPISLPVESVCALILRKMTVFCPAFLQAQTFPAFLMSNLFCYAFRHEAWFTNAPIKNSKKCKNLCPNVVLRDLVCDKETKIRSKQRQPSGMVGKFDRRLPFCFDRVLVTMLCDTASWLPLATGLGHAT